jgi:hypothetical protein
MQYPNYQCMLFLHQARARIHPTSSLKSDLGEFQALIIYTHKKQNIKQFTISHINNPSPELSKTEHNSM